MKSLSLFQNIHSAEPLIVCGCGESLVNLKDHDRFITIGVNDVGRRFQPNYLVVVNPRNQFSGDRFRFVENSQAEYLFTQLDLGVKHPKIVRFQLGTFGGTDFSNPNVLHYTNNSPYIALCLAILMGARRIGLIGVDFTDHHFFAKTGKHPLATQFDSINEQYCRLAVSAKSNGIEIFNLSKISRLTAFPKISVDEFENFQQPDFKTTEKAGALKIVSYATTPVAGVPAVLARCINTQTEHSARCVWATNSYGNGVEFAGDVEWQNQPQYAEHLLSEADLIIVHNGKIAPEHENLLSDQALLTMAHNYLWNVDERFVKQGFAGVVVGQYQAALDEFENWSVVPNPIPFWEREYKPEAKPEQITICYTPSGKHEKYPLEHRLYWHSKGYQTTVRILEKLAKQFPIKLEVIRDRQISHSESLAMKGRSHIVIDECVTGSYHRNSLEGLACGAVVVNGLGILPKVVDVLHFCAGAGAEIPFVSATLENLEEVLTKLIQSGHENLIRNGANNRAWLENHWDFSRQWQKFWIPATEKSFKKINRNFCPASIESKKSKDILSKEVVVNHQMKVLKDGVSVVIPHGGKYRLPHLRACLANLRQCRQVGEIIVVEMDESPLAVELARRWADKYVFIRRTDLFERARTLNIGSSFAECEFVLWLDNDLLIPNDFISRAVIELCQKNLDFLKPYTEVKYLSLADSENVMQGILNPDQCRPANIYSSTTTDGGAGLIRREFLQSYGGIPAGFHGWGGEDNGWVHKVSLLGKGGRTESGDQKIFHLYHALSGGNGGNAHLNANPHYQTNLSLLGKIKATDNPGRFLEDFPPTTKNLWEDSRPIYFIGDENLSIETARELFDLFGAQVELISPENFNNCENPSFNAIVFYDCQAAFDFLSDESFAQFGDKTLIVVNKNRTFTAVEEAKLRNCFGVLAIDETIADKLRQRNIKHWFWNSENHEEMDFRSLALALAQPLSILINSQTDSVTLKKTVAAKQSDVSDLPVWFYWEGARPEWIEACHRTIVAKARNARFLTPETFSELWTEDRDINISRLYVAHRADFIRAYLLAKFGGLWLDADCVVMQDLQVLLDKLGEFDFIAHREREGLFTNGLIAAKPESLIARQFYEKICKTLRINQPISWRAIGGEPLTEILQKTDAPFLELACEQVQPICWSQPEKFFVTGSNFEHERNFDENAICYMLSNGAVINYQNKNPKGDLTAGNTFFSFVVRRALGEQKVEVNNSRDDKNLQLQAHPNGAKTKAMKSKNGLQELAFYLEMIAKIAPQKVLDLDVGLGRWAVLLRDLFESSTDKKEWQMSIEAVVESKPKARNISEFLYDSVRVGKLNDCLQSTKEKSDLLIMGDYLTRNSDFQRKIILEQTLNFSDYILLNLNLTNGTSEHSNGEPDFIFYLESNPEQIVAYQRKEHFVSYLLSQTDPKKLRSKNGKVDIFYNMSQIFKQQREESVSGPGSSLKQTAEIRRSLPLLFTSLGINSMLDAPCGDYNWLPHIDLKLEKYIGIDVVPSFIEQNRNRFENQMRKFYVSDITGDFLPQCDLILCRDCLVHFSYNDIFSALRNFCKSGANYLLTTTFPQRQSNMDIQIGGWRPLNFELPPFNFPAPFKLLNERCAEGGGKFADKSLGLWLISDICKYLD